MIHLKKFNEGYIDDLRDFCENSIAYLIDDGFKIKVSTRTNYGSHDRIHNNEPFTNLLLIEFYREDGNRFNWNSVKDYFIPFYQLLSKEYQIYSYFSRENSVQFTCATTLYSEYFNSDDLINDKVNLIDLSDVFKIQFYIKNTDTSRKNFLLTNENYYERKKFNFNKDLKDFCENHLVYLLDDGFTVSTMAATEHDDSGIYIQIFKDGYSKWSLLQNNFIPFLDILSRKYKMLKLSVLGTNTDVCFSGRHKNRHGSGYYFYTLQEVLEEESKEGFPYAVDKIILKVDKK